MWGATRWRNGQRTRSSFNPRTRVGCDGSKAYKLYDKVFQSTHPCGVRHDVTHINNYCGVSIHAPVWGATEHFSLNNQNAVFQSTHPCGVRLIAEAIKAAQLVSIHAPVWGATERLAKCGQALHVSIHAPVWGATFSKILSAMVGIGFNPRTRVGCDG